MTGLHVDSWEGPSQSGRDGRRNRLCLNIGKEPRYFLFINLTLAYIREICGGSASMNGNELAGALMAQFDSYPVVRLRLDPGEAYIAPTENMIHDATTEPMGAPDVRLTLLGHFHPG